MIVLHHGGLDVGWFQLHPTSLTINGIPVHQVGILSKIAWRCGGAKEGWES